MLRLRREYIKQYILGIIGTNLYRTIIQPVEFIIEKGHPNTVVPLYIYKVDYIVKKSENVTI